MRSGQRVASMRWVKCAAMVGYVLADAAGAQSLFDSGHVDFTELQASRGQSAYMENCAACHGPNLADGQFAPALKENGKTFRSHWRDQSPRQHCDC